MPRYFFNLCDDFFVQDEEGMVLPDLKAAREMGLQNARLMAAEEVKAGKLHLSHWLEIVDEEGNLVETIPFREAFQIIS